MDKYTTVSDNFTLAEATVSDTAERLKISNLPHTEEHYENILHTATKMEQVRVLLEDRPIRINSWYRSPAVNKAVGGVANSDHMSGYSVDFVCPRFGTPLEICEKLVDHKDLLGYDQIIYEGTWVHISFSPRARKQVLTKLVTGGYAVGILPNRRY